MMKAMTRVVRSAYAIPGAGPAAAATGWNCCGTCICGAGSAGWAGGGGVCQFPPAGGGAAAAGGGGPARPPAVRLRAPWATRLPARPGSGPLDSELPR